MKKTLAALIATSAISVAALAGGPVCQSCPPPVHDGGFTLGTQWSAMDFDNSFLLTAGFTNDRFTADLGTWIGRLENAKRKKTDFTLQSHLGLRSQLHQNLFLSYGAFAGVRVLGKKDAGEKNNPYSVGAFAGLDWQPASHLLLSFKLNAFSYDREATATNDYTFFQTGSITASYVF